MKESFPVKCVWTPDETQSSNQNIEPDFVVDNIDLENWMGQLPAPLTRTPLIYLSIPGSHNSFSYSLSPTSDVSPDSPEFVQQLGKWCKPIANRIVYNWSVGQNEDVTKQLLSGIRYFDFRLVSKNGDIYISHGLFGSNIEKFLMEVCTFMNNHSKEALVFDFQHFYDFRTEDHRFIANLLERIFGNKICRRGMLIKDLTLDYLWRCGNQAVIIYRNSFVNYTDLYWPSGSWITIWPNKIKTRDLLEYLDDCLINRRSDVGFVSQGILTPTTKYIVLHMGSSLKKLALKNNKALSQWLDSKSSGKQGLNVVMCDFIESYAFCDKVVRLNYKTPETAGEIKRINEAKA